MPKLFIAAGHGNIDSGAVSEYGIERDIAIAVVDKAFELCVGQDVNGRELVKVPNELGLEGEINWINDCMTDANNDMCAEVHLNSNGGNPGTGVETYYGFEQLAQEMNEEIVNVLGLRNRGVKEWNGLMFNNSTNCGSCLIELGFINNPVDANAIITKGGLALAKAMVRACNGTWSDPKPPVVVAPPIIITPPTPPAPVVVPEPPKPEPEPTPTPIEPTTPLEPPTVIEPPVLVPTPTNIVITSKPNVDNPTWRYMNVLEFLKKCILDLFNKLFKKKGTK